MAKSVFLPASGTVSDVLNIFLIFFKKIPWHFSLCLLLCISNWKRHSSLAQSVEHSAVNRVVVGSSPTGGAKNRDVLLNVFIFFFQIEFGQWQLVQTGERLLTASWPSAAGGRRSEGRMAQRSTEKRRFKEVFRRAPQEMLSLVRVQLGEPRKKHLRMQVLFSVIFAWGEWYCYAVVLCCA